MSIIVLTFCCPHCGLCPHHPGLVLFPLLVLYPQQAPVEATPRTIEDGPSVEPDAYGIYHAANTPVG